MSNKRREMATKALRISIDGKRCLKNIDGILSKAEAAYQSGDMNGIPALKLMLDGEFKKLNKILPDLKQVELNAGDDLPVLVLSDLQGNMPFKDVTPEVINGQLKDGTDEDTDAPAVDKLFS